MVQKGASFGSSIIFIKSFIFKNEYLFNKSANQYKYKFVCLKMPRKCPKIDKWAPPLGCFIITLFLQMMPTFWLWRTTMTKQLLIFFSEVLGHFQYLNLAIIRADQGQLRSIIRNPYQGGSKKPCILVQKLKVSSNCPHVRQMSAKFLPAGRDTQ